MECKSLAWDLERIRRRKEVRLRSSRRRSAADTGIWTRHTYYETETYVGEAVAESGIRREEFCLLSKVWKDEMGYDGTLRAFERTLENLGTDYLDLYLIHWPKPAPDTKEWKRLDVETWKAMEKLYREKRVRAIGVSNFLPHHIREPAFLLRSRACGGSIGVSSRIQPGGRRLLLFKREGFSSRRGVRLEESV